MRVSMDKDKLIEALTAKLEAARMYDAAVAAAHKVKEAEWERATKDRLRAALKLRGKAFRDEVKVKYGSLNIRWDDAPTCPDSMVRQIENAMRMVSYDRRRTIQFDASDTYGQLLRWEPGAGDGTVC